MALQFSKQNLFDLGHYDLTSGWSKPSDFKGPAIAVYRAVLLGVMHFVFFHARREQGRLVQLQKLISRKTQRTLVLHSVTHEREGDDNDRIH